MKNHFDIGKGDVLSLDPGTSVSGVALWRDGVLIDTRALRSDGYELSVSERLRQICLQLKEFLRLYSADVKVVLTENPDHTLLKAVVGAILLTDGVDSYFNDKHTISSSEWKSWAKQRGASHPEGFGFIKGIAALKSTGFKPLPETDDEADAMMVYLSYRDKYGAHKSLLRRKRPDTKARSGASKRMAARKLDKGQDKGPPTSSGGGKKLAGSYSTERDRFGHRKETEGGDHYPIQYTRGPIPNGIP